MSENVRKPKVDTASIIEFLSGENTFVVPSYQRNYAWEDEQVNQLLEDLDSFCFGGEDPYYLLGQIILAPNRNSDTSHKFAVVDGQQRMTTVYLLLIALQEQFRAFNVAEGDSGEAADAYRQVISGIWNQCTNGQRNNRFEATKFAARSIDTLLQGEELPLISISDSAERVRENFQSIDSWVRNNLKTLDALVKYTYRVLNEVFLIRADLDSEEQALDIFEKINNRGKALNSAELFKNLLFSKVSSDGYNTLDESWNKAGLEVYKVDYHRAASMEYLMQALLQQKTGSFVSTKNVYKAWSDLLPTTTEDVNQFAANLVNSAKKLALVGSTKGAETFFNRELVSPKYFGVVQHLPVALAATRFDEQSEMYKLLTRFIDARIALFLIAEEKANTANIDMWKFSKAIADLPAEANFQLFLNRIDFGRAEAQRLIDAAAPRIRSLRYSNSRDKKRMRFILASIANWAEGQVGEHADSSDFAQLLITRGRTKYDLDHVLPQSAANRADFDASNGTEWINSIGNLTLLHSSDNREAQAISPKYKSVHYASSKLFLTQTLAMREDLTARNPRVSTTLLAFDRNNAQNVENWDFDAVQKQADFYVSCFSQVVMARLGLDL
jgi:hypothetical protein